MKERVFLEVPHAPRRPLRQPEDGALDDAGEDAHDPAPLLRAEQLGARRDRRRESGRRVRPGRQALRSVAQGARPVRAVPAGPQPRRSSGRRRSPRAAARCRPSPERTSGRGPRRATRASSASYAADLLGAAPRRPGVRSSRRRSSIRGRAFARGSTGARGETWARSRSTSSRRSRTSMRACAPFRRSCRRSRGRTTSPTKSSATRPTRPTWAWPSSARRRRGTRTCSRRYWAIVEQPRLLRQRTCVDRLKAVTRDDMAKYLDAYVLGKTFVFGAMESPKLWRRRSTRRAPRRAPRAEERRARQGGCAHRNLRPRKRLRPAGASAVHVDAGARPSDEPQIALRPSPGGRRSRCLRRFDPAAEGAHPAGDDRPPPVLRPPRCRVAADPCAGGRGGRDAGDGAGDADPGRSRRRRRVHRRRPLHPRRRSQLDARERGHRGARAPRGRLGRDDDAGQGAVHAEARFARSVDRPRSGERLRRPLRVLPGGELGRDLRAPRRRLPEPRAPRRGLRGRTAARALPASPRAGGRRRAAPAPRAPDHLRRPPVRQSLRSGTLETLGADQAPGTSPPHLAKLRDTNRLLLVVVGDVRAASARDRAEREAAFAESVPRGGATWTRRSRCSISRRPT